MERKRLLGLYHAEGLGSAIIHVPWTYDGKSVSFPESSVGSKGQALVLSCQKAWQFGKDRPYLAA